MEAGLRIHHVLKPSALLKLLKRGAPMAINVIDNDSP